MTEVKNVAILYKRLGNAITDKLLPYLFSLENDQEAVRVIKMMQPIGPEC